MKSPLCLCRKIYGIDIDIDKTNTSLQKGLKYLGCTGKVLAPLTITIRYCNINNPAQRSYASVMPLLWPLT